MLVLILTLTTVAIVVRIVSSPLSNVFQKQLTQRAAEPLFVSSATYGFLALLTITFWPDLNLSGLPADFWWAVLIFNSIGVLGNVLLIKAIRTGELSVLGPVNAYKSVVSILFGIVLLNEIPSWMGAFGVVLIIAGSYFVLGSGQKGGRFSFDILKKPEIQLRLIALVCSAIEAVFLKRAMLLSTPMTTFVLWCALGFLFSFGWVVLTLRSRWKEQIRVLSAQKGTYAALFISVGLMQFSTNTAFGGMQVGYVLALFQTSVLLNVLFGYQFFKEKNIVQKLIGAAIMVTGAVLIVVYK
ncbi:EamA family transporter [Larkinella rosea]|uniref:EamA/RhaT family transporter n=1 Tax=Larkinella rosea TaxID=2025312 RepID=A0A3P1BCC8_9BACT|nr:EamA family transporter [Larkinella rosea]RRA98826.1 EamA/RhaT family transporter [Larkinella rosea]